jgi:hypothetical protein
MGPLWRQYSTILTACNLLISPLPSSNHWFPSPWHFFSNFASGFLNLLKCSIQVRKAYIFLQVVLCIIMTIVPVSSDDFSFAPPACT